MAAPERRKLDDLKPHPRLGTTELLPALSEDEYAALKASVAGANVLQPIVIDENNVIIDGHHRARAAKDAGYVEVNVMVAKGMSDEALVSLGVTLNAARRQLNTDQKRAAIATLLVEDAKRSDRSIASVVGASPTTVGTVRADLEDAGAVSKVDTRRDTAGREQPASKPISERTREKRNERPKSRADQDRERREAEFERRQAEARAQKGAEPSGVEHQGESVASEDAAPADELVSEGPSGSPASDEPVEAASEGRSDAATADEDATGDLVHQAPTSAGSPSDDERLAYLLNAESALAHAASFRGLGMAAVQTALETVREVIAMLRQEAA